MNINVSDEFITYGINLASLIFAILVMFLYFAKGKSHKISSKVFLALILMTIFAAGLNITSGFLVAKGLPYANLLGIIANFFINCWNYLLMFYISICFKTDEYNREFYSKHSSVYYIGGGILILINLLGCIFFEFEFVSLGERQPYIFGGALNTFTTIIGLIAVLFAFVYIIVYRSKLDKLAIVLGFYSVVLCAFSIICNVVGFMPLNNTSFLHSIAILYLFLSIESQDALLIAEFKDSTQKANEYNKLRSEFIMNMSHQLRTPLTSVLGFSDSLINSDFNLDELKEDSKNIYLASKNLLDLINSINDVSKLDSNREVVNSKNYSLDTVIYDVSSIINSYITKDNLIFTINADEICPNDLYGDDSKINKILNILLMTAVDHTNYGEVSLHVSCTMIDTSNYEMIFHIKNSGHALSVDDFDRNLDDLIKLSSNDESNIDAKTLNLIIAKSLIDIIGGNIEFINESGKGTQFIFKIKQKITSQEKIGNIKDKIQTKQVLSHQILNLSDKRVLIVADNKMNSSILERLLNQYSFNIDTSISINDAISLFNTYLYDVIFVDDILGEMKGSDFVAKLNSTGNRIPPVIGVINKNSVDISVYHDVIEAPIEFRNLNIVINKIFEKGGNVDEL